MTADVVAPEYLPLPAGGWYRRAFTALRAAVRRSLRFRLRCLIFGHEYSFARQPHRLMLRCASCGRETVGWAIGPGTPAVMAAPRPAPARRTAAVDAPIRVGPWTLRRREGRGEARTASDNAWSWRPLGQPSAVPNTSDGVSPQARGTGPAPSCAKSTPIAGRMSSGASGRGRGG